ncbi:MAG: hypothetical protein AAF513_16800 [Pseudomonadota bacterium]
MLKVALLLILIIPSAAMAELAGRWILSIDTPRGTQNPELEIVQDEQGYSGTYHSLRGPVDIETITRDGNAFAFQIEITVPIGAIAVTYEGTIDGDSMSGKVINPRGEVTFTGKRDTR